jgi:hypothetical protein
MSLAKQWAAELAEHGLVIVGQLPLTGALADETYRLTERFVREADARAELEQVSEAHKLCELHGLKLRLERYNGGHYKVIQADSDGDEEVVAEGDTATEASGAAAHWYYAEAEAERREFSYAPTGYGCGDGQADFRSCSHGNSVSTPGGDDVCLDCGAVSYEAKS